MENYFRLLIIEDDENEIINYSDNVELFNEDTEVDKFIIKVDFKKSLQDGLSALKDNKYDAAIVDLRLKQDNFDEAEGNKIIKSIVGNLRMPVAVVSGFLGDIDPELKKENGLVKFYDRGDVEIINILENFKKIY
ncbi:MAG: hypothetical protein F8N39_12455, partial [Clostridiaceae bacterium]|nr:hypothetical protein [Clostridiaceae bacterium]